MTFAILFASVVISQGPSGNYWGLAGALSFTCFAPAVAAAWIAGRGGRTPSWPAVVTVYALCFVGLSLLSGRA